MQRSSIALVVFLVSLVVSCGVIRRSGEFVFNRFKVSTPSMSPSFNLGDVLSVHVVDSFQRNQIVAFHPPAKYRFDNPDVIYVFRLIGLPGDSLSMKTSRLFLEGRDFPFMIDTKLSYRVETSMPLNESRLKGMAYLKTSNSEYVFYATQDELKVLRKNGAVKSIEPLLDQSQYSTPIIYSGKTIDTWGPFRVPKKGDTITVTEENRATLELIVSYETEHEVPAVGEQYVFTMNYYFVLGDNRHNALDSRWMGFIPEDQIVGVAIKH